MTKLTISSLIWPKWKKLNFILNDLAPSSKIDLIVTDKGWLRNYGKLSVDGPEEEIERVLDYLRQEGE